MTAGLGWRGCWRIARRDLHRGLRGLRLLFICLFLGVARALAADELVIGQALADRLMLKAGDVLHYGNADFRIRDIITDEPDRVGEGFTLGPVAITSLAGVQRSGLIQPGSLYESKYRIRMPPGEDARAAGEALKRDFPAAGFTVKTRDGAAPGTSRFFENMGQFLSLIGLTALAIAGIGVSNGVTSYLAIKRDGIATLKILGASTGDISRIYLMQIGAVAALATGCGLLMGAGLPILLLAAVGDLLPVQPDFALTPLPFLTSAAYGLLIAFIFIVPPLAHARTLPAAALFREMVDRRRGMDRASLIAIGCASLAAIALALGTARQPMFAASVLGAVAAVILILMGIGLLVRRAARRMKAPRAPLTRLAIASLHRPGAQTSALVIALGLGLTLFVTLAAIQSSLSAQIRNTVPQTAPDQFVLDIPIAQKAQFQQIVAREAPGATVNIVPALRGTIVAYGATRVADLKELPKDAWFLRGERGVTYSDSLPEGSELTEGAWWPKHYAGPPLVSLDREAAEVMQVGVGDMLTISVLGREIEARIASLRQVNWETMGFNYIMVFSPNSLRDAPHSLAATIMKKKAPAGAKTGTGDHVSRALLATFPSVSIIAVSEVVGQVTVLLGQMATAIVMAGSVAILAGIAVLIGAIAASRQARAYDSVILKMLGATRWQILGSQAIEYALLATILSLVALALGLAGAWFVIVRIFAFTWAPDWMLVGATLGGGALLTLGIGLLGAIPLMSVRPARALRTL